jgi:hypothetical protein
MTYHRRVIARLASATILATAAACGSPPSSWRVPDGWKHELFRFPLDFAPTLPHRGLEEVRFPPGFLTAGAVNHWAYAFVWRLDDPAQLEPATLATELATYFRGLLTSVDGDKHRLDPTQITVTATTDGATTDGIALSAHLFDTFGDATPFDLVGTAKRTACGHGSLWTFVLAPPASPIRPALDELAATATCGQAVVP